MGKIYSLIVLMIWLHISVADIYVHIEPNQQHYLVLPENGGRVQLIGFAENHTICSTSPGQYHAKGPMVLVGASHAELL